MPHCNFPSQPRPAHALVKVPRAHIVALPKANFYMFLSSRPDIVRGLRAFAAGLK